MSRCPWYRSSVWICSVVGLLGAALYLPTLGYEFVNIDDPWLIQNNATLHRWSWQNLWAVWFDLSTSTRLRLGGEYLPVRDMSVLFDYSVFFPWIGGFHLTQTLLYGTLCVGWAWVILTWLRSPGLAWIAGTLYAVHPIHVEAVAWLSERKGLLSGVFLLFGVIAFHRFAQQGRWSFWFLSVLLLVASVWSKAVSIAGIGWLAVLLWLFPPWQTSKQDGSSPQHGMTHQDQSTSDLRFRAWVGWFGLLVCVSCAFVPVWITGQRVQMVQSYHGGGWGQTLWLMGQVHFHYIQQMFWAFPYSIKYPVSPESIDATKATLGLLLAAATVGIAVFGLLRPTWRVVALVAWTWLLFLVPVSQILLPLQNIMADRYLLLPSMAMVLLVALGMSWFRSRWMLALLWGFLLILSGVLTWKQTQTWSSTRNLYQHACQVHPRWINGMMQLAHIEATKGRMAQALQWVERAKQIDPFHPKVAIRESLLLLQQGKPQLAVAVLRKSASLHRDDKVRANLALLLQQQGQTQEAYRWAMEAVAIRALVPHNQRVLGVIALQWKRWDVAEKALLRAYELEPHRRQNVANLGVLYQQMGQPAQAETYFNLAKSNR